MYRATSKPKFANKAWDAFRKLPRLLVCHAGCVVLNLADLAPWRASEWLCKRGTDMRLDWLAICSGWRWTLGELSLARWVGIGCGESMIGA